MSLFLHTSTRLYTDVRKAYTRFTKVEELEKWFAQDIQETPSVGQSLSGTFEELDKNFSNLTYSALNKEENIRFSCPFNLVENDSNNDNYEVEIKFMQCTSETYYCTEIHLMQYGFDDTEESIHARTVYLEFWKNKLDVLRELINKDWVIQDSELTLRCFK